MNPKPTLSELENEEARLWSELETLEVPYKNKQDEWATVHRQLADFKNRAEIKAELLAEMKGPQKTA